MTSMTVQPTTGARSLPLLGAGACAGVAAAVATVVVAAAGRAADVPLEIDGEPIPMLGFAVLTLVGALLGTGMAAAIRRREAFVGAAVVATGLSLVPSLTVPDDTATALVLAATHLVAAAIVVPLLARRLPAGGRP